MIHVICLFCKIVRHPKKLLVSHRFDVLKTDADSLKKFHGVDLTVTYCNLFMIDVLQASHGLDHFVAFRVKC